MSKPRLFVFGDSWATNYFSNKLNLNISDYHFNINRFPNPII